MISQAPLNVLPGVNNAGHARVKERGVDEGGDSQSTLEPGVLGTAERHVGGSAGRGLAAVVGAEDYDGVVDHAGRGEALDQGSQGVVQGGNHG